MRGGTQSRGQHCDQCGSSLPSWVSPKGTPGRGSRREHRNEEATAGPCKLCGKKDTMAVVLRMSVHEGVRKGGKQQTRSASRPDGDTGDTSQS